jgi:spermidine synthase
MLSLHFDAFGVQSLMSTDAPATLMLRYTRIMMGFLLFNACPGHVGIIGLGGGSLPKYCYRHLRQTRISVAEISPAIIALRHRFLIPNDDERFFVSCEDGADFVRQKEGQFDILMVDGFDANGQPPQLCSRSFYEDCYRALTKQGILVVNICDSARSLLVSRLNQTFHKQVIVVDGEAGGNTIAFAGKGHILGQSQEQFTRYSHMIEHAAASIARVSGISHSETF